MNRLFNNVILPAIFRKHITAIGWMLVLGALVCFGVGCSGKHPSTPNVLLMVYDDLGPHLASYGDPNAQEFHLTPNFDRLAGISVQFNRSYCQVAVCGPSRASFLTGLRPDVTTVNTDHPAGASYSTDNTPEFFEIIKQHPTLLNYFNAQGYYTARIGKIHHSWNDILPYETTSYEQEPDARPTGNPPEYAQYADSSGLPNYWQDLNNPLTRYRLTPWGDRRRLRQTTIWEMHVDYDKDDPYRNRNTLWTERALHAIDKAAESHRPFFIAWGPVGTHFPYCQPKEFADKIDPWKMVLPPSIHVGVTIPRPIPWAYYGGQSPFSDGRSNWKSWEDYLNRTNIPEKPWEGEPIPPDGVDIDRIEIKRKMLQAYYAAVSFADYQTGRLLDKLESLGLMENTIILAFGDHGFHIYDHNIWNKTTQFEYATRTFTYLHVPGARSAGRQVDSMIEFVDFYPTLIDLCGFPIPERCQGTSVKPLLDDAERPWKRYAFTQFRKNNQMGYSIRSRDFRYTAWLRDPDGIGGSANSGPEYGEVQFEELYDFRNDPLETKNLAGHPDYRTVQGDLRDKVTKAIRDPVNGYKAF